MERFTHGLYSFTGWERGWETDTGWNMSDLYREMDILVREGIPLEAMELVCKEYDRRGGHRYYRLVIARSADVQVKALAERIHQAWLAKKAIEDEQYHKQYEAALANQASWGDVEFQF